MYINQQAKDNCNRLVRFILKYQTAFIPQFNALSHPNILRVSIRTEMVHTQFFSHQFTIGKADGFTSCVECLFFYTSNTVTALYNQ